MKMRILDLGYVSALQSQAIYHGIAHAMQAEDDPVLCLCSPLSPYICVGMHQDVSSEVDEAFCQANNLPIFRRYVGGGTVYLDKNQLFFQFIFPRDKAPKRPEELYPFFINPVVSTYQHFGIAAHYHATNDIQVHGKKIGGTGAASIENATVMVGSFLFEFNFPLMLGALRCPSSKFREKLSEAMQNGMTTIKEELSYVPQREEWIAEFIHQVERLLLVDTSADEITQRELEHIESLSQELSDREWIYQEGRKLVDNGVKISANRYLTERAFSNSYGVFSILLLSRDGIIEEIDFQVEKSSISSDVSLQLAVQLPGTALTQKDLLSRIPSKGSDPFNLQMDLVSAILDTAYFGGC